MPTTELKKYLDEQRVRYVTIPHAESFTAQEIAASAHVPGKELAKTVVVQLGGEMALAVLPASRQVDLPRLAALAGSPKATLASEKEFKGLFPGCEPGAMPPFGNLYGLKVFADESLTADEEIAFNAGTHTELVRLAYRDFERLAKPVTGPFSKAA